MSNAIESLIFVVKISAGKLKTLVQRLDTAPQRQVSGLLAGIEKESTVLSQSTQKLSVYVDTIREKEISVAPEPGPPIADPNLLKIVGLLNAAVLGEVVCAHCGGIRHELGGHEHVDSDCVPDDHAKNRALAAEARR